MRELTYSLITGDPACTALVPAERWFSSTAADSPVKPFGVIRVGPEVRRMGDVWAVAVTVHVHDEPGSYVNIDKTLAAVQPVIMSSAPRIYSGKVIIAAEDLGWSEDLFDDHYGTATRNAAFNFMGRK